jgi:general secretion pathway protein J
MFKNIEVFRKINNQQGFTLLELLIAITITGIILGIVFSFLQQGLVTWERTGMDSESDQYLRVLENQLRKDLQHLFYSDLYKDNQFKGDYQGMEWLIIEDQTLKEVSYTVDYYYNQLTRRVIEILSDEKTSEGRDMNFRCGERLQRVDFHFYDPHNNYWRNNWSCRDIGYLPSLVRVNIFSDGEEKKMIFEIYVGREY